MKAKILDINNLLWLALALALLGSLRHLAEMFASVDGNLTYGYLSAVAVDCGLFSLSYSIKKRKAERRGVKVLWFGIVLFTVISVYGNLTYGILATDGQLPFVLSVIRPVILAASLPILVLYLAELVSDNQRYADKVAEREAKKAAKSRTDNQSVQPIDKARQAKADKLTKRRDKVLSMLREDMSEQDMAAELDVSVRTIQRDITALNGQGVTA